MHHGSSFVSRTRRQDLTASDARPNMLGRKGHSRCRHQGYCAAREGNSRPLWSQNDDSTFAEDQHISRSRRSLYSPPVLTNDSTRLRFRGLLFVLPSARPPGGMCGIVKRSTSVYRELRLRGMLRSRLRTPLQASVTRYKPASLQKLERIISDPESRPSAVK